MELIAYKNVTDYKREVNKYSKEDFLNEISSCNYQLNGILNDNFENDDAGIDFDNLTQLEKSLEFLEIEYIKFSCSNQIDLFTDKDIY